MAVPSPGRQARAGCQKRCNLLETGGCDYPMENQLSPLVSPPKRLMRDNIAQDQIGSSRHIARVWSQQILAYGVALARRRGQDRPRAFQEIFADRDQCNDWRLFHAPDPLQVLVRGSIN